MHEGVQGGAGLLRLSPKLSSEAADQPCRVDEQRQQADIEERQLPIDDEDDRQGDGDDEEVLGNGQQRAGDDILYGGDVVGQTRHDLAGVAGRIEP